MIDRTPAARCIFFKRTQHRACLARIQKTCTVRGDNVDKTTGQRRNGRGMKQYVKQCTFTFQQGVRVALYNRNEIAFDKGITVVFMPGDP